MVKALFIFLILSFILWILPLGYFIKPSLEKLACDGQRAMCMCHAMVPKASDKAMEHGLALKSGASTNKENASAGNYFVSTKPIITLNLYSASIFAEQFLAYKSPYLAAFEYVPKI